MEFVVENVDGLDTQQVIKCVLVLWEQFKKDKLDNIHSTVVDANQPAMIALIRQVSEKASLMNPDELTTCLLYLSKLGFDMHVPVMSRLREIIVDALKEGMF